MISSERNVFEIEHADLSVNSFSRGKDILDEYGCLLIRNCFPSSLIEELKKAAANELLSPGFSPSLVVGNGRKMHTITISPPWNNTELYCNKNLLGLFKKCLGEKISLGSMTVVNAVPGAASQHLHRDYDSLYADEKEKRDETPAFAITVLVPLVPQNSVTGNTRVWPRSHKDFSIEVKSDDIGCDYTANIGDCLLMDYRLLHCGLANRSNSDRPILSMVYSRPWFEDKRNFKIQSPLKISNASLSSLTDEGKELLAQHTTMRNRLLNTERIYRNLRSKIRNR